MPAARGRKRGRRNEHPWSAEEDALVRELYPDYGMRGCHEFIPNRSVNAINQRAAKLRVGRKARTKSKRRVTPAAVRQLLREHIARQRECPLRHWRPV